MTNAEARASVAIITAAIADIDRKIAETSAQADALHNRAITGESWRADRMLAECLDEQVEELRHERYLVGLELSYSAGVIEMDRQTRRECRH